MRVSVLGTGDMTKIPRMVGLPESEVKKIIVKVGVLLAVKGHELVIIPDRGVPIEIAKVYKDNGGKQLLGIVPTKDTQYGTTFIEGNLSLLDKQLEVDHWYDADGEIAAAGDVCIVIGMSPGIMREVCVLKYHYRYLNSKTKVVWFKNTLSAPLPKEIAEEIPITYVESVEELERFL